MSNFDELVERLDALAEDTQRLVTQNAWMVEALKHLLADSAGIELAQADEFDEWLADTTLGDARNESLRNEFVAPPPEESGDVPVPIHPRRQPAQPPCPHNRQVVVDGVVKCGRCGTPLTTSGLVQDRVGPNGHILKDPDPPQWATEHSRGASSKNPGGALVPHSD